MANLALNLFLGHDQSSEKEKKRIKLVNKSVFPLKKNKVQ